MKKLAKILASFAAVAFVVAPAVPASAVAIPGAVDGAITLQAGATYDGGAIPADTKVVGNGATIAGTVTVEGDNVTIDGVTFKTESGNAIVLKSATNVAIQNNKFTGAFSRAISGNPVEVSNLNIANNTFSGATISDSHDIYIQGTGSGVNVTGNHLDGIVQLRGNANDARLADVDMSDNVFQTVANDNTGHTMLMAMYVDGLTVHGNEATLGAGAIAPVGDAISLNGGISNADITDNTISGFLNGISSWTSRYFATDDAVSDDVNISDNTVSGVTGAGVSVAGGTSNVSIAGNTIDGGKYGIRVYAATDNTANSGVEIAGGNTISNATEAAIYVQENAVAEGEKVEVVTNANTFTNNAADIVAENDADVIDKVEVEVPDTTDPVTDDEEAATDEADVTAPNTGTTIANFALVLTGITVAVLTAVYATRFASAKK